MWYSQHRKFPVSYQNKELNRPTIPDHHSLIDVASQLPLMLPNPKPSITEHDYQTPLLG
jgi:hypothetical protein